MKQPPEIDGPEVQRRIYALNRDCPVCGAWGLRSPVESIGQPCRNLNIKRPGDVFSPYIHPRRFP